MNIIVTYLFLALFLSLGSEEQAIVCRNLFKKFFLNLAEKKKREEDNEILLVCILRSSAYPWD